MKLIEALKIVAGMKRRPGEPFNCFVASGLNLLHLTTFLAADLSLLFPDRKIDIQQGLYGDFPGNLGSLAKANADSGIVLMEWSDLDPRLGVRSTAPWSSSAYSDIVATVRDRALTVQRAIREASPRMPVVVCLPTLPLPPILFVPGWQASSLEIDLKAIVQSVASQVCQQPQVRVLSAQRIDSVSPFQERFDIESDLLSGFPYRLPHASALADLMARLVQNPTPKKGLITDLDDTLWRGLLGEVGIDGVSWDLDHHSQMHAFYQRFLGTLSSSGVLIGIASKNDRKIVEAALARRDLALPSGAIFPLEVNWGPKSESVTRILKTWNIGADSVVFVDDSPLELAEVKASHPDMECIQFPTMDNTAIYDLTLRLRDLFGKSAVSEEDSVRVASIRNAHASTDLQKASGATSTGFLQGIQAEINFNFGKTPLDPRALELVNKTNQFNLNGKRYSERSWSERFVDPLSFLLLVSYEDKFGPLGKIAVIAGRQAGKKLNIETWVMSCRAFCRQIEHRCIEELFSHFDVDKIEFAFGATERNGPLQDFLREILAEAPFPECILTQSQFLSKRTHIPSR